MGSTSRAPAAAAAQTFLPDEIWEDIFLRLDAAADLARASSACSSFHRVVSEHRFLRRFRSLRSPAVLGFISKARQGFLPLDPPHRSAPEARALEQAADFTFSFVPDPHKWLFRHARDGRVLLSKSISTKSQFPDFIVCDPLHRRYVKIPRIPYDLLAAAYGNGMAEHVSPVLVPAVQNDEEESFRIIRSMQLKGKVVAFVFSSCNQTWRAIISTISLPNRLIAYMPCYAHGCLYWMYYDKGNSLMLDTIEMKYSTIELPPHNFYSERVIVEAEENKLRFITIDATSDLYCKNWQSNGVGAQEWKQDKLISLANYSGIIYDWQINGIAGHYLALSVQSENDLSPNYEHFILDVKKFLIEKLCTSNYSAIFAFPYARFPPPLALPSI